MFTVGNPKFPKPPMPPREPLPPPELVTTLYTENPGQIAATLRSIADGIEAGEYGQIDQAALVLHLPDDEDPIGVFGMGDKRSHFQVGMLLSAGFNKMIAYLYGAARL